MLMMQGYINLFVLFITATAILYLPIYFILKKKGKCILRQLSYLLCFWSLFLIVFTTIILFNLPIDFNSEQHIVNLKPLIWLEEDNIKRRIMSEIGPNIMIFIPFGIFTPIAWKQMRIFHRTMLTACIVTCSVEFFQYFIGRLSDIDDLIANLLGGIIGYGMFKSFSYLFKNKEWWRKMTGTGNYEKGERK